MKGIAQRSLGRSEEDLLPNRQLSADELETLFAPLITQVRERLVELSMGDGALLWALRRKLFKELMYDERGKPMHRRRLKELKRAEQDNKCAVCASSLPARYAVLDRVEALENTRLICQQCDTRVQAERGYA
jgi:hypothetical protein